MNDIFGQPIENRGGDRRPNPQPHPQPHPQPRPEPEPCPGNRGTLLRVYIAAGTTISLLGLLEVTSPSGICLLVNLPFLNDNDRPGLNLGDILDTLKKSGCKVEFVNE